MKQGASVAVDACDLVHASFCFSVTADVGNQVLVSPIMRVVVMM